MSKKISWEKLMGIHGKKPSLTYAIPYFDETGVMRGPYLICKGFLDADWNVEILTTSNCQNTNIEKAWDQVPVNKIDGYSKKIKLIKLAKEIFKKKDKGIVITWVWYWHCFALMFSKWLYNSPYILVLDTYTHLGNWETKGFLSKLRLELRYGLIMRYADVIMAETPQSFANAKQNLKGPEILQVPVCFWEKDLRELEDRWIKEDYDPKREPIIFYAGQIVERKNIHDLIASFNQLSKRFSEWRLEIRGPVTDPLYLSFLKNLVRRLEIDERVDFLPSLSGEKLYKRYRATSIYCLPSRFEGMPSTILEAMFFGGAIIAANAGHIAYQLDEGNCGLLFEPGDCESLTEQLEFLISSEVERERYMKKARERCLALFTWEKYFHRIESVCRQLSGS